MPYATLVAITELLSVEAIFSDEEQQDQVRVCLGKTIAPGRKLFRLFDTIVFKINTAEYFLTDRWTCQHFIPI